MQIQACTVRDHVVFAGDYRMLTFDAPEMAARAQPGQFIHLRIPELDAASLRRPFSIYRAEDEALSILYKPVGRGTVRLPELQPGATISVIGPLGHGFPTAVPEAYPVLIAGGYGVAPLSFFARRAAGKGTVFIGGRTQGDILCVEDFEAAGWDVRISTEDGSRGAKGMITDSLDPWLLEGGAREGCEPEFFACGPEGLMRAISDRANPRGWSAWISLDNHMGCGVGACLVCVQKIRADDGSVGWQCACREGPVFRGDKIVWDEVS